MIETSDSSSDPYRNTRRYAWLGALFGLSFPLVATWIQLAASGLPLTASSVTNLHAEPVMWIVDLAPVILAAFAAFAGRRQDLLESNARMLEAQARELQGGQLVLERRVQERTAELEHRDRQMLDAVQITRQLARIRDLPELASTAVQRISESLAEFSVDLYTVDQRSSEVVRTASSEGEQTPAITVRAGEAGLVGQVAASGVAGRTEAGTFGQELAVPLRAYGRTTGVLHVRAISPAAKLPSDYTVLELLADHLAAALESSRLYSEARGALEQLQALAGQGAQADWNAQPASSGAAYEYSRAGIRPVLPGAVPFDSRSLRIPLELRGQTIGAISIIRSGETDWTDADRDLAAKAATQVALALENVRLLEETRDRAAQEQRLSEFSARLGQSVDLDSLLQTAVRELAGLPEVAEASIYLSPATVSPVKVSS